MTPEEYAAQLQRINAGVALYVQRFAKVIAKQELRRPEWNTALSIVYPEVESRRYEVADLARRFYDAQRAKEHPELPRNDRPLEGYSFERFTKNMEPARSRMSQMDARDDAIAHMALRAVREVENGARRQMIHAVEDDDSLKRKIAEEAGRPAKSERRVVRGWARVATGRETCAWCLMLVSRGPVYMAADTAGLDLSDETAARMIAAGLDVSEFMQEWHTGCDCKVVPVFKEQGWVGEKAAARALELWNEATEVAIAEEEEDPNRVHTHGESKGDLFTRNERALNALRRRLAAGDIDVSEFAALAA